MTTTLASFLLIPLCFSALAVVGTVDSEVDVDDDDASGESLFAVEDADVDSR